MAEVLRGDNLRVSYGHGRRANVVLRGINFTLAHGETLGLVGESGSGKTTLGRAILGLVPIVSGKLEYAGEDITTLDSRRRRRQTRGIQVVFQDPYTSLNPSMTIRDILSEPLIAHGTARSDSIAKVRDLLDRVGMPSDSLDRYAREFSGGQRQRIAIARALTLDPNVIVCDEPVSALDLSTQMKVLDLFIELQEKMGIAYLFISHDLAVVRYISHRVAVMRSGEIVETGDGTTVTEAPQHPYTQKLWAANLVANPVAQRSRRESRQQLNST